MFAVKAGISDPRAETFAFSAQKTMYGGKAIAAGDLIFLFASENEGGLGLVAMGVVTSVRAVAKRPGIARQTPRVSISVRRTASAKRRFTRSYCRKSRARNSGRAFAYASSVINVLRSIRFMGRWSQREFGR